MECPWCRQVRYSRDWKRSQWASWSPVTEEYNACKVCSVTGVCTDVAEVNSTWKSLCHAYNYVAGLADLRSKLGMLIEAWMIQVSSGCRKELSHLGHIASRVRPKGSFDPVNWTYHLGMKLLYPDLLVQYLSLFSWWPHFPDPFWSWNSGHFLVREPRLKNGPGFPQHPGSQQSVRMICYNRNLSCAGHAKHCFGFTTCSLL